VSESGPFDPVSLPDELDKVSRFAEYGSHVCFSKVHDPLPGSLGAFDDRPGFGDPTLDFAGLRSGERWVHAGADGGDQPVELGFKALYLETGAGDLG
jgi:hypothetical protein